MTFFEFVVVWLLLTIRADQCIDTTTKEKLFLWKCLAIAVVWIVMSVTK